MINWSNFGKRECTDGRGRVARILGDVGRKGGSVGVRNGAFWRFSGLGPQNRSSCHQHTKVFESAQIYGYWEELILDSSLFLESSGFDTEEPTRARRKLATKSCALLVFPARKIGRKIQNYFGIPQMQQVSARRLHSRKKSWRA
jgi:hypothetical protein